MPPTKISAVIAIAGFGWASAQPVAPPRVAYEAASVKPSKPNERFVIEFLPGGRFRTANMPLFAVVATAYDVSWQSLESLRLRMRNVPDWALAEKYDIEATPEQGSASAGAAVQALNERIRLMLQSVLSDRFKLRMRREAVEMRVYALMTAARGPKLERAKIAEQDCTEALFSVGRPAISSWEG